MADGLWHLLIHTPGPAADPAVPFFEADWFPAHRSFQAALADAGHLIAAGPLPQREGAGQTLVRGIGTEQLGRLAHADPAVAGGYLVVEIVPWRIVDTIVPDADADDGPAL